MDSNDKKKLVQTLVGAGMSLTAAISAAFLITPSEGKINHTYIDPVGIITSCYGHTGPELKMGQYFTDNECLLQLAKDTPEAEKAVDRQIVAPLNMYQKAALISWTYNFGETKLHNSTLRIYFNDRKYEAGCDELLAWVYANKKKMKGLETRRALERSMCLGQIGVDNVINQ